jgi:hypothetical protein
LPYFEEYREYLVKVSLGQIEQPDARALIPRNGPQLVAAALNLDDCFIEFAYNRYR